jgi:hypothetical protein
MSLFSEDYLVRIITQAMAVLMTAVGLKKAGKYSDALQAIQQAIEQVTTLPANLVDQMDDGSLLVLLTTQGKLDIGRLAILADLYQEQGENLINMDQAEQGSSAFSRALRFNLEVALSEVVTLSSENIGKIDFLTQRLKERSLPIATQLALSDHYQRLLEMDDQGLTVAGTSRQQVLQGLSKLQDLLGPPQIITGA